MEDVQKVQILTRLHFQMLSAPPTRDTQDAQGSWVYETAPSSSCALKEPSGKD